MNTPQILGLSFIALAALICTAERICAHIAWAAHKSAVAINGSGRWSNTPDYSTSYSNPALWICLAIGTILIFQKTKKSNL
jgi:hypothetical protein